MHEVQPIISRTSNQVLTNGYSEAQLLIALSSPCELLTNDTVPFDVLKKCDRLYEEPFLSPIEKLCPLEKQETNIARKQTNDLCCFWLEWQLQLLSPRLESEAQL